jgi:hypothetical protein
MANKASETVQKLTTPKPLGGKVGAVHQALVQSVLDSFPNAKAAGFMQSLKTLPNADYITGVMADPYYRSLARFTPDAYLIDTDRKCIVVFEAIDKSDITESKLGRIMDLAFALDEDYWDLALVTVTINGAATYAPMDLYSRIQLHKIDNPDCKLWLREWKLWAQQVAA